MVLLKRLFVSVVVLLALVCCQLSLCWHVVVFFCKLLLLCCWDFPHKFYSEWHRCSFVVMALVKKLFDSIRLLRFLFFKAMWFIFYTLSMVVDVWCFCWSGQYFVFLGWLLFLFGAVVWLFVFLFSLSLAGLPRIGFSKTVMCFHALCHVMFILELRQPAKSGSSFVQNKNICSTHLLVRCILQLCGPYPSGSIPLQKPINACLVFVLFVRLKVY